MYGEVPRQVKADWTPHRFSRPVLEVAESNLNISVMSRLRLHLTFLPMFLTSSNVDLSISNAVYIQSNIPFVIQSRISAAQRQLGNLRLCNNVFYRTSYTESI